MTNTNMKIAFFGTPNFTVDFLKLFKSLNLNISLIVTGEDKPSGRGMLMHSPGPKTFGDENGIKVLQPKKLDTEFFNSIKDENFDLFVVIAYGKIIPENVINLPRFGTINLHYSLLPKYRGASPVESAILNGDSVTGIAIQQMVYKLDAGNILFQEELPILSNETTSILRTKLNTRALEIFPEFLENFFAGNIQSITQDESLATSCGKFKKEDLDVTNDLKENNLGMVFKKYKAYDKKVYFFHTFKGKKIRVKITDMDSEKILKVLPESKKEILKDEFESAFGLII